MTTIDENLTNIASQLVADQLQKDYDEIYAYWFMGSTILMFKPGFVYEGRDYQLFVIFLGFWLVTEYRARFRKK